jgi:hypothetical protein
VEPQRAGRSPLPFVIGVLVVLALVVGAIAVVREDDADGAPGGVADDGPSAPATSEDDVDAVVAELSAFVADVRQLELLRPVEVTLLEDEAFRVRVREDALTDDLEELAVSQRVFRALGILDRDVDLRAALLDFLEDTVVGFYDPETDDLVVRGGTLNAYVRSTLVHEIVHALDDQHFELHRPALDDADDEAGLGFATLVEGNAVRVQELYDEQLSEDERAEYAAEQARIQGGFDPESVPPVVAQLIGFPYLAGPSLVRLLAEQGGERRVDEAFDAPPATSEQALDPASWLAGDAEPMDVAPPPADGEVIDEGTIGEWGLVVVLGRELGQEAARDAAAGWGGDWYVAWADGDRTCVRATIVMDTPEDLVELDDALDEWADNQLDASVERSTADGGSATFTSCG